MPMNGDEISPVRPVRGFSLNLTVSAPKKLRIPINIPNRTKKSKFPRKINYGFFSY